MPCSEKLQETQELHLRLCRPQHVKVNENTIRKRWTSFEQAFFGKRENIFYLKRTAVMLHVGGKKQYILDRWDLSRHVWTKYTALHLEKTKQHISKNTSNQLSSTAVEGWWFGLCFIATGSNWKSCKETVIQTTARTLQQMGEKERLLFVSLRFVFRLFQNPVFFLNYVLISKT